jgi:hypothetical protein
LVIANPAKAQTICNFDTLFEQFIFFQNDFNIREIYQSESSTGWRKAYTYNNNPNYNIYIGHNFTPDITEMDEASYLQFLDVEISKTQQMYLQSGFQSKRSFEVNKKPFNWNVVVNPNYDGRKYYEKYETIQVGNKCNLIVLQRYPVEFANSSTFNLIQGKIIEVIQLAYSYQGPISLKEQKFLPTGIFSVFIGIAVPLLIFIFGYLFLLRNSIMGGVKFNGVKRGFVTILPILSSLYLFGSIVAYMIDNQDFLGYEIAAISGLFALIYMIWGIMGEEIYIPLSIYISSLAVSIIYLLFDWTLVYYPYLIYFLISMFSIFQIIIMAKSSLEERQMKKERKWAGMSI